MIFKSKIKWVALTGLIISLFSLMVHLLLANFSNVSAAKYSTASSIDGFSGDFALNSGIQGVRHKSLWGVVKRLESLQPYANPRANYLVPRRESNGFIYAKIFGGFANIRSSICDLVTISRLLNASLVIPEIQASIRSKGISSKFKSFSYLYNEEQFISSLRNDVIIVKSLPERYKTARKKHEFPTFTMKNTASPRFYIEEVLPTLKKSAVIGLILNSGGCLQSILPPKMAEYQRLRCRVSFHALHFRPEIQLLGRHIIERLRAGGRPFLAFHPGLLRDTLAYHGCAELFQDVHTELIQYRRAQMIRRHIINGKQSVDSHLHRENGSCPLMPEEVGIVLRAMGYPSRTIIYLAGTETFGGQRVLTPLRAMFPNLVDSSSVCSKQELSNLVGPESPILPHLFQSPPAKTNAQLQEEWKKAGPRPRPLPPPPGRPFYRHEKEGWYGWIGETPTEPDPSPLDLRMQAHRLVWEALDYIVSVEADAFFPGFDSDGSGWPDFSGLVMGHRLYGSATSRTYRPDRKFIAQMFNGDDGKYRLPRQRNWTISIREHLNKSLGKDGMMRHSLFSKSSLFLSHPVPECSCRISSSDVEREKEVKSSDGRYLFGGEDKCPDWMQREKESVSHEVQNDETESGDEYGGDAIIQEQSDESYEGGTSPLSGSLWSEQDDEMDPND